ncbi:hypothetical protein Dimus_006343, partial [Dionaea muscipula]
MSRFVHSTARLLAATNNANEPKNEAMVISAGLVMASIPHGFTMVWLLAWRCALLIAAAGA